MTMIVLLWPKLVPDGVTVTGYSTTFGDGDRHYGSGAGDGGFRPVFPLRDIGSGISRDIGVYYGDPYTGDGYGHGVGNDYTY